MSVQWLAPVALLGLLLVALPIAIHLLVREQTRRVLYPSLRFLRQSQLAAFRRRSIQDAALLACRAAILAAAAVALAGPVVQTASRRAAQAGRVATAVVIEPGAETAPATSAVTSFASKAFARAEAADAIAEALLWLEAQPPASREIAFAGSLRRGAVAESDLLKIPSAVGIRFVRQPAAQPARQAEMPVLMRVDGSTFLASRVVRLEDDSTEVSGDARVRIEGPVARILATPADQPLADAALRAALSAGIRWPGAAARALVVWPGVDDAVVASQSGGATLVRMERPALVSAASAVADALATRMNPPMAPSEPVQISDEQLRAWSRPPGPPPASAPLVDEGDRRWLWLAVLVLLALEHLLRKSRADAQLAESGSEARVA